MPEAYDALLLLGGNLGNPIENLGMAEHMITHPKRSIGAHLIARSRDHWTEPWGFTHDRPFLNRALLISSALEPLELLGELLSIEIELGRHRSTTHSYEARIIDIDILLIGEQVIDLPALRVPHPRMHERAFALAPAADIVPLQVHPLLRRTVLDLLNDLRRPR